ncbi:oligopeptide binding protein 1, partial [Streptococcus thermophilus MTCC 5461]
MKLKKILGITGVALLSVGVLAACSSKSSTSGTTYSYIYRLRSRYLGLYYIK